MLFFFYFLVARWIIPTKCKEQDYSYVCVCVLQHNVYFFLWSRLKKSGRSLSQNKSIRKVNKAITITNNNSKSTRTKIQERKWASSKRIWGRWSWDDTSCFATIVAVATFAIQSGVRRKRRKANRWTFNYLWEICSRQDWKQENKVQTNERKPMEAYVRLLLNENECENIIDIANKTYIE